MTLDLPNKLTHTVPVKPPPPQRIPVTNLTLNATLDNDTLVKRTGILLYFHHAPCLRGNERDGLPAHLQAARTMTLLYVAR